MPRKKIEKKTVQSAPERKVEELKPARTDEDDDIRFLESRGPDREVDPLSTSARVARSKRKPGDVAFFSRYKNDEVLLEPSAPLQVGANKWVMQPSKWIRFNDRMYTTGVKEIIEHLRNHERYGFEILEFGVAEHVERIALYDTSGRLTNLEKLNRLAKASERRWELGIDDG